MSASQEARNGYIISNCVTFYIYSFFGENYARCSCTNKGKICHDGDELRGKINENSTSE